MKTAAAPGLDELVHHLAETPEMNQGHYTQFHRVLDQLEATTEALIIDVEQTLRRLRDRHDWRRLLWIEQ